MKIKNINETIKKMISSNYNKIIEKNIDDEDKMMEEIEDVFYNIKNKDYYKYIIGLLYTDTYAYLYTDRRISEESKEDFDYIDSYDNLDVLEKELDFETFCILLDTSWAFQQLMFLDKKEMYNSIKDLKKLINFFPPVIIDLMYYLNSFDKMNIIKDYENILYYSESLENAKKDTVYYTTESLLKLNDLNHYNYKYLVLDIIEDFYKYVLFLKSTNNNVDDSLIRIMDMIDDDILFLIEITTSRNTILEKIVDTYLDYELSDKTELIKYYDDNSNKNKLSNITSKVNKLKLIK